MRKILLTSEQIETLKRNPNVKNCSKWSTTYSNDFKVKAVKQYEKGLTPRNIFNEAGLDLKIIGKDAPKESLKHWNKIYKRTGVIRLQTENRGLNGGQNKLGITEKDRIKRLEVEVAYLKAENDFLIKLRAKRAK